MARRRKLFKIIFGVLLGIITAQFFTSSRSSDLQLNCKLRRQPPPLLHHSIYKNESTISRKSQDFIFVGVMTAAKYLETRARAVHDTWGRSVPGQVVFFSSEGSHSEGLPLVALPGVDDSYPPQKKSLMMLKHMYEHFGDRYEWFVRADDDVYVRTDRLAELLRGVDSGKAWFIGQTGRGSGEELGQLALDEDENFCMGGPGVILSRETLRRVAPHVEECLAGLVTNHEDVELGRCVKKFAGISCTWSYEASGGDDDEVKEVWCCFGGNMKGHEMQVILYHNQSGQAAFTGDLKQKEVHRAITLHPVKHSQYMYRLDKYVKALKIQSLQHDSIILHRDIVRSMAQLGYDRDHVQNSYLVDNLPLFPETRGADDYLGDPALLGIPQSLTRYNPPDLDNVHEWDLIFKSLFTYKDSNPRKRIGSSLKEGLSDVVRDIMEVINSYSKQRGRVIDFKEILYGYWRLDPLHGVDLILDLLLVYRKYRGHKMTVEVRRHAYVQQTFTGVSIREVESYSFPQNNPVQSSSTPSSAVHKKIVNQIISTLEQTLPLFTNEQPAKKEIINFILPISGRFEILKRFLRMYIDVCVREDEFSRLVVILYKSEQFENSLNLLNSLKEKYRKSSISVIEAEGDFNRAHALEMGVKSLHFDDLMMFIDVDIVFDLKSLLKVRQNTIKNKSLYYPIVYSLYNPALLNKTYPKESYEYFQEASNNNLIDEDNGFWRQFGFGVASLYKSDYVSLGGFNLSITGWGLEDVTFYDNSLKSKLKIVRSVDPSMIHVYHPINCDINLDVAQKFMCLGTKASMLGSLKQLQEFYRRNKYLFR